MRLFRPLTFVLAAFVLLAAPASFSETANTAEPTETAAANSELTAKGYVRVTAGDESRWYPLPEEEEYTFTIRQTTPYGTEMNNTIAITPDGVYMKESDCENQDCVGEGTVTLENKADRVLGNMIICLPHQITIELYSTDELTVGESEDGSEDAAQ